MRHFMWVFAVCQLQISSLKRVKQQFILTFSNEREHSGSVEECLTRDRGAAGSNRRHCIVSLSKIINPSLVLVQPRKTHPFIFERLLMGRREPNQTKQNSVKRVSQFVYRTNEFREKMESIQEEVHQLDMDIEENQGKNSANHDCSRHQIL